MVADLFATLGSLFVMLFAMFFLVRDGHTLARQVRDLLPIPEAARDRLMTDTRDLIIASVGAGLVVAAVQGTIGGITFWLLGIKAAVIWGVVMAFCSLVPLVGAALVWGPTALWLLLSGDVMRGIILILIGTFGIGLADNVLRPLLLAGRTTASGLVVFLGLLGGAAAFGFIGLVLGPIVLLASPPAACCGCSPRPSSTTDTSRGAHWRDLQRSPRATVVRASRQSDGHELISLPAVRAKRRTSSYAAFADPAARNSSGSTNPGSSMCLSSIFL